MLHYFSFRVFPLASGSVKLRMSASSA